MMFKFVVLVGFVACAVAAPAPEDAAPVRQTRETYDECVKRCAIILGKPQIPGRGECFVLCFPYKRSMIDVVPTEQMKRAIDVKIEASSLPIDSEVAPVRNARAGYMGCDCSNWKPSGSACLVFCALHGGRSMTDVVPSEQMKKAIDVEIEARRLSKSFEMDNFGGPPVHVDPSRPGYMDCVTDCGIRMGAPWNPTAGACFAICAFKRSLADNKSAEQVKRAIDAKMEARISKEECVLACAKTGFYYSTCVLTHCNGLSKSLPDDSFASVSSLPTNSASLMQITEPIANILSQVIKKQQELEKMIQSCNCAKPLTPFGLDNGAVGPYF